SNGSFECNGCLPARSKVGPWCPADLPHSAPSSKVLAADIGLQTVSILIANPLERLLSRSPQDWELSAAALHRQLRRERALVEEFASRVPPIPLVQHRTGQDDSALGTAAFADLEARPRRIFPTDDPAVTYVELTFRYASAEGDTAHELNLGHTRLYARIEDPLYLEGRGHTVEQVRDSERLRSAYFRRVFALMA